MGIIGTVREWFERDFFNKAREDFQIQSVRPELPRYHSQMKTLQEKKTTDQYPMWILMQKFSTKY